MRLLHSRIHIEVFAGDNDFLVKVFEFFLLELRHFLHHIFTRDENCLEIVGIRECLLILDFAVEIGLAVICWVIQLTLQLIFGLGSLANV